MIMILLVLLWYMRSSSGYMSNNQFMPFYNGTKYDADDMAN